MISKSSCPLILSLSLSSLILATSLGRMEMVRTRQYHHSNNSDMEDSTVTPSKTDYYVPVSALCAESTINRVLLKIS